jgi:signal transduction histidine kinase
MQATVDEALTLLRAIVPANVEIVLNAQVEEITLSGDPSLVHQVVINLCTNAYQSMSQTGGRLLVRLWMAAERTFESGWAALLEVTDTGHGIEAAAIPHVFEPFYTTREVGEGTGLGLSVVHGIVTSMGGKITVESDVGRGTTFRVYWPLAASSSQMLTAVGRG